MNSSGTGGSTAKVGTATINMQKININLISIFLY
jgi:hypothetical protein